MGGRGKLTIVVGIVIVAAGVWITASRWSEVMESARLVGIERVLVAAPLMLVGVVLTAETWRRWLNSLHRGLPWPTSHRFFYLTQAGKYLPGSVWPIVAQTSLSRRFGVARTVVVASMGLFLITHVVTGTALGVGSLGAATRRWAPYLIPAAVAGGALLTPPAIRLIARFVARLRSLPASQLRPSWSTTAITALLMLGAWAGYGTATYVLSEPLGADVGDVLVVAGSYSLAWVVGFLALPAPAGVGAREGAFVALMAPVIGVDPALTVALLTRLLLTLADLGLAAVSASVLHPRHSPGPPG